MSNTTNLNLFKHDNPSTNTNPFNIESALNGNWDKIDTYAGNTNTAITNNENSIEALQQENQRLKETLVTTTGTGETITLNKTAEMEFVVPPLPEGNTVQDGEPTPTVPVEVQVVKGDVEVKVQNENLLPLDNQVITKNGVTVNIEDGIISLSGTLINNAISVDIPIPSLVLNVTDKFSVKVEGLENIPVSLGSYLLDESLNLIRWSYGQAGLQTHTNFNSTTNTVARYFRIALNTVGGNYNNITFKIMFEKGNVNSNFVVGKKQLLPLNLPVENLANMEYFKENYTLDSNGLPVASSNRVTNTTPINVKSFDNVVVSFKNNTSNTINFIYSILDVNNNLISRVAGNINKTSIDTSNAEYLYVCFYDNVTLQSISEIQIEPGLKANHYTPYGTTPIELCKIGDYKDYPWKDLTNGKWYWHKEIGKYKFTGDENWTKSGSNNDYYELVSSSILHISNAIGFCNRYKQTTILNGNLNTEVGISIYLANNLVRIRPQDNLLTNITDFKNDLSSNETILYYPLKEKTNTEITDTTLINQLEAIYNAISYEEQTNISGTSNGISPLFDVEAYQSTKLLLEDIINSN